MKCLLLFISLAYSHITLVPNYGVATGGYKQVAVKIPHGTALQYTSRVEIVVPHGLRAAKPHAIHGWNITIETRNIKPYTSHGRAVTTGPAKIILQAQHSQHSLHNDHLLIVDLQIKLGCEFNTSTGTASVWNGQHTLWWPMKQITSHVDSLAQAGVLEWTGIPVDDQSWGSAQPKPCPYTFIYSGPSCTDEDSGEVGMVWDGELVEPDNGQGLIKDIQHVESLIEERILTLQETIDERDQVVFERSVVVSNDSTTAAYVAIGLACLTLSFVLLFCFLRCAMPNQYKVLLLGDADSGNPEGNIQ